MRWWLTVPTLLFLATPGEARSQSEVLVLAGVDSVTAQILLQFDEDIPNLSENTIKGRLQTVLELELRRNDVVVSEGSLSSLWADLNVIWADGLLAYAYDIHLEEPGLGRREIGSLISDAAVGAIKDPSCRTQPVAADSVLFHLELRSCSWDNLMQVANSTNFPWMTTWHGMSGVATVGL